MHFSSVLFCVGVISQVWAIPASNDAAVMENIKPRVCNQGNWCCTIANPSNYCIQYCAHGSQYINCGASYVSTSQQLPCKYVAVWRLTRSSVSCLWSMPVQVQVRLMKWDSEAPRDGVGVTG